MWYTNNTLPPAIVFRQRSDQVKLAAIELQGCAGFRHFSPPLPPPPPTPSRHLVDHRHPGDVVVKFSVKDFKATLN